MRMRSIGWTIVVTLVACSASGDHATPAPTVSITEAARATSCPESPPLSSPPTVAERSGGTPPGRALFAEDGVMRVYEGDRLRTLDAEPLSSEAYARMTADRISALVNGPDDSLVMWSEDASGRRSMPIPAAPTKSPNFAFSRALDRILFQTAFGASEVLMLGVDMPVARVSLGSDLIHVPIWRNAEEATLMVGAKQDQFPLRDVTLWSWAPPASPARLAGPVTVSTYPSWSPDGTVLATVEETPAGRSVRLRGAVDRTLVTEADLARGPDGCLRGTPRIITIRWSPDGKTLAIVGVANQYFVAFVRVDGSRTAVFSAPGNAGACYLPGVVDWSRDRALVPIFGPDCGAGGAGLANALAVVDPATGKADAHIPISRKGYLASSGRWVAIGSASGNADATVFFSLDDPLVRFALPYARLVSYCCAP